MGFLPKDEAIRLQIRKEEVRSQHPARFRQGDWISMCGEVYRTLKDAVKGTEVGVQTDEFPYKEVSPKWTPVRTNWEKNLRKNGVFQFGLTYVKK